MYKRKFSTLSERNTKLSSTQSNKDTHVVKKLTQKTQSAPSTSTNNPNVDDDSPIQHVSKRYCRNSLSQTQNETINLPKKYYFEEVLERVNFNIQHSNTEIHLIAMTNKEPPVIAQDLQSYIKKSSNSVKIVKEFMDSLKEYCKVEKNLKKLLLPTQITHSTEMETITGLPKDSLIRILLSVDSLQSDLIDFILENLTNYAIDSDDNANWTRLLIRPLAFLPQINKSETLATNLLDVIESADNPVQLELITNLPEILPDIEHGYIATRLTKLIRENAELTPAILDCLGHLSLYADKHKEVKKHLLSVLQSSIPLNHLPILTDYLLSTCEADDMNDIIQGLRTALFNYTSQEESQSFTFSVIQTALMRSKQLCATWLKIIVNIKQYTGHRAIDIVILIILYATITNQRKAVENVFKKKILAGHFKITLLENTFKKYLTPQVFKEYINSLIDIASTLMRMKGALISDFATTIYILAFTYPHANIHQRQEIIHSLIVLTGDTFEGNVKSALNVLKMLAEDHSDILQSHSIQLLNLLDRTEELELCDIRCIMDILCKLAFSTNSYASASTLQDDLHILIKKQLNSSKKEIQLKGIIGAIMAAKHLACRDVSDNDENSISLSQKSTVSISDIPNEDVRQAANFINLVIRCTKGNIEATGLAYDQLAAMLITTPDINKSFLVWLSDSVTSDFQKDFIVEDTPTTDDELQLAMKFCVNEPDEEDSKFAVNIGGLCVQNQNREVSILCLAPLFRLMRLVHYRQNSGDLSAIDAVLGCSIIMPDLDPDLGVQNLDPDLIKIVLDCYFHCVNWFREVINAFVLQKSSYLQKKVLLRIKGLIQLEDELAKFMLHAPPDYKPPPSRFPAPIGNSRETPTVIGIKRKITKVKSVKQTKDATTTIANVTNVTLPTTSQQNVTTNVSGSKTEIIDHGSVRRSCFRDLDIDILTLLRKKISFPMDSNDIATDTMELTLTDYKFLLEDIISKLEIIVSDTQKSKSNDINMLLLQLIDPLAFLTDCIRLFPNLTRNLHSITKYIHELLESCDGVRDAPDMYKQNAINAKVCFSLILEFQMLTLSWPGLHNPANIELLREGLRNLLDKKHGSLKFVGSLVTEAGTQLSKYVEYCLYISAGVNLVKFLKVLISFSNEDSPRKTLVDLCGNLLAMSWNDLKGKVDGGAQYNIKIDYLIKTYFMDADIDKVQRIISWMQEEAPLLKTKGNMLQTFPSIQKANFPLLYRGVASALVTASRNHVDSSPNHLILWRKIVVALQGLVIIVKIQEARSNLSAFLRRSLEIIKLFLMKGIPILEIKLKSQPETVVEILRILQQSTRFLHNLCCHSKLKGDGGLMGLVPSMKSTLEALIYKVKAALVANNCSSAFWMGNLRNKDINGEEILSQSTQSTVDNGEDEDQLPPDDPDDQNTEDNAESSEIF